MQQPHEETGTRDDTYDVISVVYHALQGAENCQIYAEDAEDGQLRSFFQQACDQQRQLAEQGQAGAPAMPAEGKRVRRRPERLRLPSGPAELRRGLGPEERDRHVQP